MAGIKGNRWSLITIRMGKLPLVITIVCLDLASLKRAWEQLSLDLS